MRQFFRSGMCFLLMAGALVSAAIAAEEGAEGGEAKPKPQPKPVQDSAISVILALPEVQAWQKWMASKDYTLEAWGVSIRRIDTDPCWEVAVVEKTGTNDDDTHKWIYFCVNQYSKDVLVEQEDKKNGETIFLPYEKWKKSCDPLPNSPGKC